jgi:hypothetical protein
MHALPTIWTHKNYCRNNPRCVKCAAQHLTSECPRKTKDDNILCVNCHEKHPVNYRGCIIHKQLQQKMYPAMRNRNTPQPATPSAKARPIQTGVTYAQATKEQHGRPQPNQTTSQTTISEQRPNEQGELKQMMTNLINQMNILINLITALVSK